MTYSSSIGNISNKLFQDLEKDPKPLTESLEDRISLWATKILFPSIGKALLFGAICYVYAQFCVPITISSQVFFWDYVLGIGVSEMIFKTAQLFFERMNMTSAFSFIHRIDDRYSNFFEIRKYKKIERDEFGSPERNSLKLFEAIREFFVNFPKPVIDGIIMSEVIYSHISSLGRIPIPFLFPSIFAKRVFNNVIFQASTRVILFAFNLDVKK